LSGNNCWKTTLEPAKACLPAKTDPPGKLSADNTTCTFANGTIVTFDSPLALPIPQGSMPAWNFSVTNNGGPCLRVQQSDATHEVVTSAAGTVRVAGDANTFNIACPDGTSYSSSTGDVFSLLATCDAGLLAGLPAVVDSSPSMTNAIASLLGVGGAEGSLQAFDCTK
jgi:hypothetical protein